MQVSDTSDVPAQISVAFRVLGYCRSLTDPFNVPGPEGVDPHLVTPRKLTSLEAGMETSALNLIRNWLNGEQTLPHPETTMPISPEDLFQQQADDTPNDQEDCS